MCFAKETSLCSSQKYVFVAIDIALLLKEPSAVDVQKVSVYMYEWMDV